MAIGLGAALVSCKKPPPPAAAAELREWQLLASELPSALLSVSGRSSSDVYAVGADKGHGPLVLHFDGKAWSELRTGQTGDLWWVQALPDGPALMAGASATVLRYDGQRFERLPTPGLGKQTVYGVWGKSADDFYAVGSAAGRDGFIWHYREGAFENESAPARPAAHRRRRGARASSRSGERATTSGSSAPAARSCIARGRRRSRSCRAATKDTLFTVHGTGDRLLAVGGGGNGVLLELGAKRRRSTTLRRPRRGSSRASSRPIDTATGRAASAALVYTRARATSAVRGRRPRPRRCPRRRRSTRSSSTPTGGVWSAGGNVLTPALDRRVLLHYGDAASRRSCSTTTTRAPDAGAPPTLPRGRRRRRQGGSIARRWDEQTLAAIRLDLPRPTVHARNLFHVSAAMWDAWAGYDAKAKGVFVRERHTARRRRQARARRDQLRGVRRARPPLRARHRRRKTTLACLRAVMEDLGYDPDDAHDTGDDPIAFGNRIGTRVIAKTADDGANEANDYADPTGYTAANPPLVFDNPGAPLKEPERWQPLNLSVAATQNGIILPAGVQDVHRRAVGRRSRRSR